MQYQKPSEFDKPPKNNKPNQTPGSYYYNETTGQYYSTPVSDQSHMDIQPRKISRSWLIPLMVLFSAILLAIIAFVLIKTKQNKPNNPPQAAYEFGSTLTALSAEVTIQALSAELTQVAKTISQEEPLEVLQQEVTKEPTEVPIPTPNYCDLSPFKVGDSAWVERGVGQIALYSSSSPNTTTKDWLSPGDVLLITGPKVCVDGHAMWPVKNTHMVKGWVLETSSGTRNLRRIDTWNACSGRLPTRLTVNQYGFVQEEPVLRNIMRLDPNSSSPEVNRINPGRSFLVLDGPECASGQIWWKIRDLSNDKEGWTRESGLDNNNIDDYFIAPKMP